MKSYTTLIQRSLRGQPRRALLTMLSIFLSVALLSAAGTLAASLQQTKVNQATAVSGDFHGTFNHLTREQVSVLKGDPSLSAVGVSAPLGSIVLDSLTITLEGFDPTAIDLFGLQLSEGRFPQAVDEIALESWVLEKLDPQPAAGDRIHFSYFLYSHNETGEVIDSGQVEGDFILTGVLEDIAAAKMTGVSLGLVSSQAVEASVPPGQARCTAFVQVSASPGAIRADLDRLQRVLGLDDDRASVNESVVRALESGRETSGPVLLLAILVGAASAATIYNIFQISVVERVRHFGILRALGATPAQVARLVLGEALLLSLPAIPLGLAFGVGAAAVLAQTLALLQSAIAVLAVPAWVVAASAGSGMVTTLVSALAPALFAGRISPLAAIQSVDRSGDTGLVPGRASRGLLRHSGRASGLIWRMSGRIAGRFAYHSLWRNRLRSLVTIFSLGLGVVLCILFSSYASGMDTGSVVQEFLRGDFAIYSANLLPSNGYPQEAARAIQDIPGVAEVLKTRQDDLNYSLLPQAGVDPELAGRILGQKQMGEGIEGIEEPGCLAVPSQVFGYEDEVLRSLSAHVLEGEIDPAEMARRPSAVVVDAGGSSGLHPGDELELKKVIREGDDFFIKKQTFQVAAIVSEPPVHIGYGLLGPPVILTEEAFVAYTGLDLYKRFDIRLGENADPASVEARLREIALTATGGTFISYQDLLVDLEKEKRDLLMLVSGLVGMVTLIGAINIANTLTTHILVRTREFGMLRAVGMTTGQLRTMTRLEGLYYGLASSAWGAAAGSLLAYLLLHLMREQGPVQWSGFPWPAVLLAALGATGMSVLATVLPARRVAALGIVEAIRAVE